ncbi:NAD-binding protein [Rickettsiales bacterium LUAb2]
MKAVIAGAGVTGRKIAEYLINAGFNVAFIDSSLEAIREVTDTEGMAGIYGQSSSIEAMRNVGIKDADLFIAVTPIDEINMIACEIAYFLGVRTRIAKITNDNYLTKEWISNMYEENRMAITSVVSPNVSLINSLIQRLFYNFPNVGKVINFIDGRVKVVSLYCQKGMCLLNNTIEEFYDLFKDLNLKVIAILRDDNFISVTSGTLLNKNDTVYVVVDDSSLEKFFEIVNQGQTDNKLSKYYSHTNHITIIGDNPSILYLAKELINNESNNDTRLNIIINDKQHADLLAKELQNIAKDKVNIIYTKSFEESIKKLYLRTQEKIIIFNKNDRENVFLSLFCKYNNIDNIFCILQNSTYEGFMHYNGISNIYVADQYILMPIIQEIKSPYENNVYLVKNDFEILELTISPKSIFIGKNLRDLNLPNGITALAAFSSDGNNDYLYIKDTNLLLQEGDRVLFVQKYSSIKEANELFNQYI